jgi:hypothetical protein
VRSIQRLPALPTRDAAWIARQYMEWLPRFFSKLIRVVPSKTRNDTIEFRLSFLPWPLLVLEFVQGTSDANRQKFHIVGGFLSRTQNTGWLEFRQVSRKRFTLAAIHEFIPALPWLIYRMTQAPLHQFVMHAFGRYLIEIEKSRLLAEEPSPRAQTQNPAAAATQSESSHVAH